MIVSVGNRKYCEYEVIRYGIDNKNPKTGGPAYASVCGLLEGKIFKTSKPGETYKIASWEPRKSSESNPDVEKGAFRVQEGAKYLIHAGVLDPRNDASMGQSGCIELVKKDASGVSQWRCFQALISSLAADYFGESLTEAVAAGNVTIRYTPDKAYPGRYRMSDKDFYTYEQHPVFIDFVNKELGGNVPQQFVSSCCCIPPNCSTGLWGAPAGSGSSSNRWSLSVSDEILDCPSRPPPCPPPTKPEEAGPEITIDPLVLDLDGDGITTLSQENGVFFDFDANGFHELTGWIGAGSGLLMLDLNGNGELDDGSELFGDFTMMPTGENAGNGFHALSQYDDNQDGRIDANDAIWSQLGVYYDSEYYTPQSAGGG
jgi:hypothetical protein